MRLAVEGLEATQATQFYRSSRHLDPATADRDNAVPLVAGKPLVVRVYPDLRKPPSWKEDLSVDGELWFRPAGAEWERSRRFPGTVAGQPAASIHRGDAGQTLNFRIPERVARETLEVRTRVWVDPPGSDRRVSEWVEETFSFVETRPLRLRLYGVHFRGLGLDLPPPTAAEALHTLAWVRKTYPVSRVEVLSYETIEFSRDLRERSTDGSHPGWNELLLLLSRLRSASVSSVPHYALVPIGVPDDGFHGFGSPLGVGASFVGAGHAMAQELGHIFRLRHAPGGGAPDPDPRYPEYGACPHGSIGEYGCDPASGRVYSPLSSHDFMGYSGGDYWVSPYTYRALLDMFRSTSPSEETAAPERGPAAAGGLHLHLGFSLRDDHHFELESGLTSPDPPIESGGDATPCRLELLDERGDLLSSRVPRLLGGRSSPGEVLHFVESIPFHTAARRLAFRCCDRHDPVTLELPPDELRIELVAAPTMANGATWAGPVDLSWDATCRRAERLVFFLRYTWDGGQTWRAVNMNLEWRRCRVDLARLPGGEDCRLQVIASTLLSTATAETAPFRVRRKPRQAMIAAFDTSPRIQGGSALELTGAAHSPDGFAAESELAWTSSLQGRLGNGSYLTLHELTAGEHEITLTAPDGLGGETRDSTVVLVTGPAHDRAVAKEDG